MDSAVEAPVDGRSANARLFAAGTGVGVALIAAAAVAFIAVAAFVGFDDMPFGSSDAPGSTVPISGAPSAAALTTGSAADAVADDPAKPSASAAAEMLAARPPEARNVSGPSAGAGSSGATAIDTSGADDGTFGGSDTPGDSGGGIVDGFDNTTSGLGLEVPLDDVTDEITKPVDEAIGGVLDGVGAGGIGDKVGGTLDGD